jgi:hypothetical protein
MIEHFFLNPVNRKDDRMVGIELTHCDRCLVAVYRHGGSPVRKWQECKSEAEICQILQFNGCQEPLVLLDSIRQFAREHGVQFEELPLDFMINLQAD